MLSAAGVITGAVWGHSKDGLAQLQLYRGRLLTAPNDRDQGVLPFMEEDFPEVFEVEELRNLKPPEWEIVTNFYRLWNADEKARPSKKELAQASELIAAHGPAKAKGIIPLLVKRMKVKFPDAKTFGAVLKYVPDAATDYDRQQRQDDRRRQERSKAHYEREEAARQAAERTKLKGIWNTLPEAERARIQQKVMANQPEIVRNRPGIIEMFCLNELSQQLKSQASALSGQ